MGCRFEPYLWSQFASRWWTTASSKVGRGKTPKLPEKVSQKRVALSGVAVAAKWKKALDLFGNSDPAGNEPYLNPKSKRQEPVQVSGACPSLDLGFGCHRTSPNAWPIMA